MKAASKFDRITSFFSSMQISQDVFDDSPATSLAPDDPFFELGYKFEDYLRNTPGPLAIVDLLPVQHLVDMEL